VNYTDGLILLGYENAQENDFGGGDFGGDGGDFGGDGGDFGGDGGDW